MTDSYDYDLDEDGILDSLDNCPYNANLDPEDTDGDRIGDECDNCVFTSGSENDIDNDGIGDMCDDDKDGDGVLNLKIIVLLYIIQRRRFR